MFIVRRLLKILLRIVILFLVISVGLTLLYRWVPVPVTPLMIIRLADQYSADTDFKLSHEWVPLDKISDHLELAVVCGEDQNFLEHHGFDWNAIEKAMEHNAGAGESARKRVRGGSTISQQTAKNVFLWPGRSYLRKGLEAWFTMLIELFWNKQRIMEVYLNSIEMGNGIYGAEAAARAWFQKPAAELTAAEAAAITAILPNPRKYSANPPGPYVARRRQWVIGQMKLHGNRLDYPNETEKPAARPKKKK